MNADQGRFIRRLSIPEPVICLLLALAASAVYLPVTHFDFINLDDHKYVVENAHLREGFTWRGLKWAFTSFDPDNWFPLTRLSHMLDFALFGLNGPWHHDVNILIHALAAVMLYVFLRRATGERWPGVFVAAVFALHPMHVESVAWVSERKDVLCAFFWFATLWAWTRYAARPSRLNYSVALMLFAAGLMSKPMIVTLPLLLLIVDMWPLRRPFSRSLVVEVIPFAVLSACDAVLTFLAQRATGAVRSLEAVPLTARIENALMTVFIYIGKTFWPNGFSNPYGWPAHESIWLAMLAALAIAVISAVALAMRQVRPYLAAGWFWFLLTLLPVIGLVQAGPQARADRYMYVPMTGLLIVVSWGGVDIIKSVRRRFSWAVPVTAVLAAATCVSLAALAWRQEQYWDNSLTLFQHAVAEDDQNYLAWMYLGRTSPPARIECYRIATQIRPDLGQLRADLGEALLLANRVPDSMSEFEAALRINPRDSRPRCLLGVALLTANRISDAVSQFDLVAGNDPDSAMAHNDLAAALWRLNGRSDDVSKQLEKAITLAPDDALVNSNLGLALVNAPGGPSEAVRHFVQALSKDPQNVEAHLGLAKALTMAPFSNPAAAADHLRSARHFAPNPDDLRQFETLRIDCGQSR